VSSASSCRRLTRGCQHGRIRDVVPLPIGLANPPRLPSTTRLARETSGLTQVQRVVLCTGVSTSRTETARNGHNAMRRFLGFFRGATERFCIARGAVTACATTPHPPFSSQACQIRYMSARLRRRPAMARLRGVPCIKRRRCSGSV
jgi:hypothetical protein